MIRIEVILPAHLILKTPRTYCPRLKTFHKNIFDVASTVARQRKIPQKSSNIAVDKIYLQRKIGAELQRKCGKVSV
jgi:hypothetical protein